MKLGTILLSAAAGAAVALYFTTESGKRLLDGITERYNEKIDNTAENLKHSIDNVADKIHAGTKDLSKSHY